MAPEALEGFRLSPQQKRLWLLQQRDGVLPYRASCVVAIGGLLDASVLEQALALLVERHEILRTSFRLLPGVSVPVQVISEDSASVLIRHDLTSLAQDAQRAQIDSLLLADAVRQGDLDQLPLVRAQLVTLSPREHRLLITMPAFCADAPSLDRLVSQLAATYAALAAGAKAPPVESMQYADFAEWANQLIDSPAGVSARDYLKPLAQDGRDAHRLLPGEKPSDPLAPGFRPASVGLEMSAITAARIQALTSSRDLPLSSFLLACWQALIGRLTGQSGVIVGTAFDGRKFPELDASIGLIVSYLPIHSEIGDDGAFSASWSRVTERARDAHRRQEYFAWEAAGFFPFCFEFRTRVEARSTADLSFVVERQDACTDRFTLKFVCEAVAGRVQASLQFDSSVVSREGALIVAEQLKTLVEDASLRPDAPINELEAVGDLERQRLLVEFNRTAQSYSTGRCVHELFEDQAARTPDAVAVVYEDEQLTYRELNARANQLAHRLIESGAGPDVPVGLCVERSTALIVGLLGIVKAGAAYVPLDPRQPKGRLEMILEEAGADVVVTGGALRLSFRLKAEGTDADSKGLKAKATDAPHGNAREVIRLDADTDQLSTRSTANVRRRVSDSSLVYVIFTSGSTGRPKGVAVEHRQLVNYVNGVSDALGAPASNVAMISTIAADLGNTALFPALLTGGALHLIDEARASDPDRLGEYFERHRIDSLKIVPSHLLALLSGSKPASVLPRTRLVLGGDVLPWSLAQRIESLSPETVIVNHYGPTEATVGALTYRIDAGESGGASGTVPLGRPLANVQAYILDSRLRPAPIGVAGELHLGGRGVARGYIHRPDATADKFIPDPFSQTPGARLYQTGDRARYLADGRIEFLGRTDHQVKIHGYRVEPGEIDVALRAHPAVASCVVMPRQDTAGDTRLVAYLVAADHQRPSAKEWRAFLKDRVPE
ncbi:MAG: amino acid adenylation domain-containing protein, partial [Acidobacteriota bacterium]